MKKHLLVVVILVGLLVGGFVIPREARADCETVRHVVKPGQNLYQIARYYGVSADSIIKANNLWNPNLIYSGQVLLIPLPCTTPPTTCTLTHVVKKGEYLKMIAAKYGTTITAITQLNNIKNPNLIYPGQRLKIPTKCSTPSPSPSPSPSSKPWTGKYWNNRYFSGDPKCTRGEAAVDFNWKQNGPGCSIGGTNFSARWTRSRNFEAGLYRFHVQVDDGVRLWVDGVLIIDQWHDSAPKEYTTDKQLSAGPHNLQIDYYQNTGGAQIKFWIERVDAQAAWKGVYFNNTNLAGTPVVTRYYQTIDFDWGNKAPVSGVTADYFSARYTGEFHFVGGKYHFTATADDGIRIWVDDNLILDQWHESSVRTYGVDVDVAEGKHKIKIEYFENMGRAVCKVKWTQR